MASADVVALNNEIALYANRKDLSRCLRLFKTIKDTNKANSHTYSCMLNAFVRCGDLQGAREMFEEMKLNSDIKLDEISFTTLMKGYCLSGDIINADKLFIEMKQNKPKINPNIRTINTFLRGCLVVGAVDRGEALLQRMKKEYSLSPDISTWEYVVLLLCSAFKLAKVYPIIGRLKEDHSNASAIANMFLYAARACAILGDIKGARKALNASNTFLEIDERNQENPTDPMDGETDGNTEPSGEPKASKKSPKDATGGKKAWKTSSDGDDSRNKSLELFKNHRREEIRFELELIKTYYNESQPSAGNPNPPKTSSIAVVSSPDGGVSSSQRLLLHRILSFCSIPSFGEDLVQDELLKELFRTLVVSFGFDILLEKHGHREETATSVANASDNTIPDSKVNKKRKRKKSGSDSQSNSSTYDEIPVDTNTPAIRSCLSTLRSYFDAEGKLDFDNITRILGLRRAAPGKEVTTASTTPNLKLEICSGAGEWAVEQALQDPASLWVTLELRHERVYQTYTRSILRRCDNLLAVGGDARVVLRSRFPANTLHNIFVNHPEPPQQTGGSHSQAQHLLDQSFFSDMHRVLVPGGMLTIVTDNLWYGRLLLRQLGEDPEAASRFGCVAEDPASRSKAAKKTGEWNVHDRMGDFVLYEGLPGLRAGHVAEASSYFDRLWKRGNLKERYFLCLIKASAKEKGKKRKSRLEELQGEKIYSSENGGHKNKNKKMKFTDE